MTESTGTADTTETGALFADADIPAPASPRPTSQRERLLNAYTAVLLARPTVPELTEDVTPDPRRREGIAREIAGRDIPRLLAAITGASLEIADAGRVAEMKAALADWLLEGLLTEEQFLSLHNRTTALLDPPAGAEIERKLPR